MSTLPQYFLQAFNRKCVCLFQIEHKTRTYVAILEMLRWFAGHQIRNVAVSTCIMRVVYCQLLIISILHDQCSWRKGKQFDLTFF